MRANEFIVETVDESKELNTLSKIVSEYLMTYWEVYSAHRSLVDSITSRRQEAIDSKSTIALMQPMALSDIPALPKFLTSSIKLVIKFYSITVAAMGQQSKLPPDGAPDGLCDPTHRIVAINEELLNLKFNDIVLAVVHELQHAVDDMKTRKGLTVDSDIDAVASQTGVAFNSDPARNAQQVISKSDQAKFISYLKLPYEINARFATALMQIADEVNKNHTLLVNSNKLLSIITKYLDSQNMQDTFPGGVKNPSYRRLISRTVQFLTN